jgi:2-polyprenyl-3-methyl-5-hydroxy-6-metoxy-1,4-benzoquinol methylase
MEKYSMLTHEEMIGLQAEKHALINAIEFRSIEKYVLHLIHTTAYAQATRLVENKRVLDLGCNTGYGTDMLFRSAKKVVGVDVSEKAIVAAKNQYGHLGIEFQKINGKTLPFNDEAFDVVVSFQVIEHIVDYKKFIDEIKRIITPGGVVIFTTPQSLLRLYPGMKPWNMFHVREFNHSDLKSLLDTFFKNVSIFGLFAIEPLYSIEVNRLARAREGARSKINIKNSHQRSSIRVYAKRMLLQKMINILKGIRKFFTQKSMAEVTALMNKHGVNDFFYQQNDLESALDLLAVCCNDGKVFENIKCKLEGK